MMIIADSFQWQRWLIVLAMAFLLLPRCTVQAIVVDDGYFVESGGDVNDVAGTLDAGYADAQ